MSSEEEEDHTIVYVGRDSTRYHLSRDCHYISNQINEVPVDQVGGYTNNAGKHYKFCSVCQRSPGSGEGGSAYILPGGEYYHTRADCSSLSYYVREVPLSEVKGLGPCSYCGGGR